MSRCQHPKESRSLLGGYDIICDACGDAIGCVALFPCAVLNARESLALADALDSLDRLDETTGVDFPVPCSSSILRDARTNLGYAARKVPGAS